MLFDVTPLDRAVYEKELADFLPTRIIDVHTHIWLRQFMRGADDDPRTVKWPSRVAEDNSIEDLLETYQLLLPRQQVTPLVFGSPRRDVDLDLTNAYVQTSAHAHGLPSLLVSTPSWSARELEANVMAGGFLGLKPYLSFAPAEIPADEVTIYDFLPHTHLEVADQHGWVIMLHIPRPGRLSDPVNLAHLAELDRRYSHIRLIVAHVGRAYCREDVGDAFRVLGDTERLAVDISANTNEWVMEHLIDAIGPRRVLFGSDLPILRMRMRRICEGGTYINLVPPGLYGDTSGDAHMREVSTAEGGRLSFFLYEELLAFKRAADASGLRASDVESIFEGNATRLLHTQRS
jgi:predicted TIM-barrel fold metal-dependent hydrolase